MGVRNPYKTSKRSVGGLVSSTLLVSGVVLIALTGRGYHRRRTARSIRGASELKINQQSIIKTESGKQPIQVADGMKNASAKSSSWNAVDHVADQFGAAAEDAAGWMKGHAENILGKNLADTVGEIVDAGLDQVGELTEHFEDWFGDDEDDGDFDEEDEERDPEPGDGVHPAVEELGDPAGKEMEATLEENPKENTLTSGEAESAAKQEKEQQSPPIVAQGQEKQEKEQQSPPIVAQGQEKQEKEQQSPPIVAQGQEKQLLQNATAEQSPGAVQEIIAAPIVEPPKPEQAVATA